MIRVYFIALLVSVAASAQQAEPLSLPPAAPALTLPGAEPKKEAKKEAKKDKAAPLVLPLPPPAEAKKDPAPSAAPTVGSTADKKEPPPAAVVQQAKPSSNGPGSSAAPGAVAGASLSGGQSRTLSAQQAPGAPGANLGGGPGASLGGGPGSSATPGSDLNLRGTGSYRPLWNIRGVLGAERSSEQNYTDASTSSRVGLEATRWFSTAWLARLEGDWRTSRQQYIPLHVSSGQRTVSVDENRFDVIGNIGYDFGPRLVPSGRLELTPLLGVQYLGIRNEAFPSDVFGVNFGGRTRFYLSSAVIPHLSATYSYNFAAAKGANQNSALKSPLGDFAIRAGLALPLSGGYALELDYQGDVLSFQNTYRVAHGAALGFGSSF